MRSLVVDLAVVIASVSVAAAAPLVVGSKRFTESYILGEIVREIDERRYVRHAQQGIRRRFEPEQAGRHCQGL